MAQTPTCKPSPNSNPNPNLLSPKAGSEVVNCTNPECLRGRQAICEENSRLHKDLSKQNAIQADAAASAAAILSKDAKILDLTKTVNTLQAEQKQLLEDKQRIGRMEQKERKEKDELKQEESKLKQQRKKLEEQLRLAERVLNDLQERAEAEKKDLLGEIVRLSEGMERIKQFVAKIDDEDTKRCEKHADTLSAVNNKSTTGKKDLGASVERRESANATEMRSNSVEANQFIEEIVNHLASRSESPRERAEDRNRASRRRGGDYWDPGQERMSKRARQGEFR